MLVSLECVTTYVYIKKAQKSKKKVNENNVFFSFSFLVGEHSTHCGRRTDVHRSDICVVYNEGDLFKRKICFYNIMILTLWRLHLHIFPY